jgi:hypothetical protein
MLAKSDKELHKLIIARPIKLDKRSFMALQTFQCTPDPAIQR